MITFRIISLDVWGNEREGYEINDAHYTNTYITVKDDFTDKDIIQALKQCGELKKNFRFDSFTVEGEPAFRMFVEHKRLGPVVHLEQVKR